MMPLIPSTLATVLDPLFPVAVLMTVFALLAALVAAIRKKAAAAVGWLLVCGSCSTYAYISAPRGRSDYQEAGAVGDSRAVASSEVAYSSSNGGFFGYISCLAAPPSCGWDKDTTPFLDAQLGSLRTKQGYVRSFVAGAPGKGNPDAGITTFVYVATPAVVGHTSIRGFAVDHTGLICFTTTGAPPPIAGAALDPTCTPLK